MSEHVRGTNDEEFSVTSGSGQTSAATADADPADLTLDAKVAAADVPPGVSPESVVRGRSDTGHAPGPAP